MTRLQRRNSSCNCGKTTKESNSFVTKNKTYETRSGVQRKQDGSNGCQKNLPGNTLNLRGKVYLKKMDGPVVSLPLRNGQKMNGSPTRPGIKSSTTKICKKKCLKSNKNGHTNELINDSLKEIISTKLQVDFIDIEANLKKEDTPIPNDILTKELLVKSLTTNQDKIKNGDFLDINGDISCEKKLILEAKEKDIVSNGVENIKNGDELVSCFQSVDEKQDNYSFEQTKKKRRIVKRRTAFELFIEASCESVGNNVTLNDKRTRKAPCSFSPELPRKFKEPVSPIEQNNLVKIEENQPEQPDGEKTLIKVEEYKPVLTKKGLPFKKKGRKARPKGIIEHYLDVYVKNKEKDSLPKDPSAATENVIDSNESIQLNETKVEQKENIDSPDVQQLQKKVYQQIFLPICNATPFRNRYPDLKRKKKDKKCSLKKQKTIDKLNTEEFPSPIVFVLGHRVNKGINEMLVQFENGTSNWINYSEHELDVSKIKEYYEHSDQDLSTINRLGYKAFFPSISSPLLDSDDSDFSGDEFDINKVSLRSPSLSSPLEMDMLQLADKMPIMYDMKVDSLEPDLNNLCNFVLSSKQVKLYPLEKDNEFFVKHDDSFVNIFLKRCLKDQNKKDYLNQKLCERFISTLEDCAVDDECSVVVVYGIEEYFASPVIFHKLLKKTSALEGKKYDGDISMLRYL